MSLQGNLRDFSVTEILQLLGTQKKSGCLELEWGSERAVVFLQEGAIVSTREPGRAEDDALLQFLTKVHRLSDEQQQGVVAIQRESHRDLEDVLLKGRYMDAIELGRLVERQIFDALTALVRWENGTYSFEPAKRWPGVVVSRLSVESALIEASRRVDEHRRFMATFKDPYQILSIHDLPDPDEELYDEERELFGIIDGQHTLMEIVAAAPLTEYEAYEALDRMLRAHWIEVVGRRDPGLKPAAPASRTIAAAHAVPWQRELLVAVVVVAALATLGLGSRVFLASQSAAPAGTDVLLASRLRQVEFALQVYRLERGVYPARLERLTEEEWVAPHLLLLPGYDLVYRPVEDGKSYVLQLTPSR